MGKRIPQFDAYIARARPFAQPILETLRERVHELAPGVEEAMKWSSPGFMYGGKILATMAAFNEHASFGFWQHALVMGEQAGREGMGSFGKMTQAGDIPSKKVLTPLFKRAMQLIDDGVKTPTVRKTTTPTGAPQPTPEFAAALKKNAAARKTLAGFAPSAQREYIDWIAEAKREGTRDKRIVQAIEWLAEGKQRHWKYQDC
jgi:uncharacterized protein YdeI (YjbR/CyaY-like superfamily)